MNASSGDERSAASGLSGNTADGAINGTPTVTAANISLTFQVKDAETPAQTKSVNLTLTIFPGLLISTTSLPSGQVGSTYSATLVASRGTSPYTWSLTSGTLPAVLSLNTSTGAITGTPSAIVSNTPLTFQVKDSNSPTQTKSVNLTLTITSIGGLTVAISPKQAGLTVTQTLPVTATTNDTAGVTWSASGASCSGNACGTFAPSTSLTGVAATYTAPANAGLYTITATSATDITVSTS